MHSSCGGCDDCLCHLPPNLNPGKQQRRPHSYPRLDWSGTKPSGWHEAVRLGRDRPRMTDYQRKLFGIKVRGNKVDNDVAEMLVSGRPVERVK